MDIIYKITYIPHLNTDLPKWYIGSKKNWNPNHFYMGSVSSTQTFDYTKDKSLKDWWKYETKNNRHNFTFEILYSFEEVSSLELVSIEREIQESYNVLDNDYFNQSIATCGFVARKNSESTKRKKSEQSKRYWNSPPGIEKRKRLSEKNREIKSDQMKELWKSPTEKMLNRKMHGRPSGAKDLTVRKKRPERRIMVDGKTYDNAKVVSELFGIDPVNVRRRCRMEQYPNWSYV